MYQQFTGIGNLTKDPELRYTPGGTAVCTMSVAFNTTVKADGENKKETLYLTVETWGKMAEAHSQHLSKGRKIFVLGRLKEDTWEKDGQRHRKMKLIARDVKFLDRPAEGQGQRPEQEDIEPF